MISPPLTVLGASVGNTGSVGPRTKEEHADIVAKSLTGADVGKHRGFFRCICTCDDLSGNDGLMSVGSTGSIVTRGDLGLCVLAANAVCVPLSLTPAVFPFVRQSFTTRLNIKPSGRETLEANRSAGGCEHDHS